MPDVYHNNNNNNNAMNASCMQDNSQLAILLYGIKFSLSLDTLW